MELVLHADDFGRTESRTDCIDQLLNDNKVQRAGLIVNLPGTKRAVSLSQKHQYMDRICLHINLSEGMPVTNRIRKTKMCKSTGEFRWAKSKRILLTCWTPATVTAIRDEVEAQMQLFRRYGFKSVHIDSHDWIFYNLPIWIAVKPLLRRYGFKTTRVGCKPWMQRKNFFLRNYYRFMNFLISKSCIMEEVWSGGLSSIREYRKEIPDGKIEIMMHPDMYEGTQIERCNGEIIPLNRFYSELYELI